MTMPPNTPGYQSQSMPPRGSGLATASLVVGIVGVCFALLLGCIPFIGPGLGSVLGIVAIILGVIAMGQGPASGGRGRTGLILGVVVVIIAIAWFFALRAGVSFLGKKIQQGTQQMQQQINDAEKKAQEQRDQYQHEHPNSTTEPTTAP
jgi:ABC-type branched-subunit amino acid transport system substrate-binding protein